MASGARAHPSVGMPRGRLWLSPAVATWSASESARVALGLGAARSAQALGFSLGRERAIRPGEVARVERGQRGVAATPSASCCERPSRLPARPLRARGFAYSRQPWVPSGQIVVARQIIMCCGGQFLRVKGGTSVRARTHVGCLRWCRCWCSCCDEPWALSAEPSALCAEPSALCDESSAPCAEPSALCGKP